MVESEQYIHTEVNTYFNLMIKENEQKYQNHFKYIFPFFKGSYSGTGSYGGYNSGYNGYNGANYGGYY